MVLPPWTKHLQKAALGLTLGQGLSSWKGKRQAGAGLRSRTGPQIQANTAHGGSGHGPCWSRPSFPLAYFHLSFSASRAFLRQLFRRRLLAVWEGGRVLFLHLPPKQAGPEQDAPFRIFLHSLHPQRRKWLLPTAPHCTRAPSHSRCSPILGCFNKRQMRASRSSFW